MDRSVLLKAFTDNPIVLRDLRATMRGTRAFWFQGAYLGLLGILAVTGYAMSTHQDLFPGQNESRYQSMSIVDAQYQLQQFYYYIFVTLAALIALIAPALTATSVSDERQRQSLDLLITTPLSAFEMLTGKLISSLAFLGLLLVLSLPASALCVLLGGATIGDMFRIYAMLGIDAVVLASIGLYFSCACKNSLQSIIWTYASVIVFIAVTFMSMLLGAASGGPTKIGDVPPSMAISALCPFAVVCPVMGQQIAIGGFKFPILLALIPVAFITIRLILTAAAYRFRVFGSEPAHSLRKQLLVNTAIVGLTYGYSFLQNDGLVYSNSGYSPGNIYSAIVVITIIGMTLATTFLPGLFVPVKPEDAPPGGSQEAQDAHNYGAFRMGAILLPRHAGALPFYLANVIVLYISIVAGVVLTHRNGSIESISSLSSALVYVVGVGLMLWGIARLAARLIRNVSSARALTFGIFVLLTMLPALPLSLLTYADTWGDTPMTCLWIASPILNVYTWNSSNRLIPLVTSGIVAGIFGLTLGLATPPKKA